jgi:protein TonB
MSNRLQKNYSLPEGKRADAHAKATKARRLKYLIALLLVGALVATIFGVGLLMKNFKKDAAPEKKMVQQITVLTPPPPPPPPPPQEQIEEPEVLEEPIKADTQAPPDDAADQSPSQDLGVDAEGGAGGDSFGLVGRKGGQGLLGGGGYEQTVRQEINEFILADERLKRMDYVAVLTLKIADDGGFEQFNVEIVNGDAEAGDLIRKILQTKRKLAKPRPLEAASVVKLRVKSVL